MIRVWNYNKSRIHSYRGARYVELLLDELEFEWIRQFAIQVDGHPALSACHASERQRVLVRTRLCGTARNPESRKADACA